METKNYYISDCHFYHKNVCKEGKNFDDRPFDTLIKMHNIMSVVWNAVVNNTDHVYILGDLVWKRMDESIDFIKGLNGNKHLITGNHDILNNARYKKLFVEIVPYKELKDTIGDEVYNLVLCHYPIMFWNKQHYGSIHLYGHVHNSAEETLYQDFIKQVNKNQNLNCKAYNVGCMMWYMNYTPRTLEEIVRICKEM